MFRAAAIYLTGRIVAAVTGLLAVVIYTRLLDTETYGVYVLVATGAFALYEGLFQWLRAAVLRFLPGDPRSPSPYVGSAAIGFVAVAAATALLGLALALWRPWDWPPYLIVLGAALTVSYGGLELLASVYQARQRPMVYALMLGGRGVGNLLLGAYLAIAGLGAMGVLAALIIANAIPVSIIALWRWRAMVAMVSETAVLQRMLAFGLPVALGGFAVTSIAIADRYLIAYFMGPDPAGQYAVPVDLVTRTLQMLMLTVFMAWSPPIFAAYEHGDIAEGRRRLEQQAQVTMALVLPIAAVLAICAPLLARILVGEAFREAFALLMPWVVAAALFQGVQSFYVSYMFTIPKKTLHNAGVILFGSVVNIVLNILFIPYWGLVGAATATLIAYVTVLIGSLWIAHGWLSLPWPAIDAAKILTATTAITPILFWARDAENLLVGLGLMSAAGLVLALLFLLLNPADLRNAWRWQT